MRKSVLREYVPSRFDRVRPVTIYAAVKPPSMQRLAPVIRATESRTGAGERSKLLDRHDHWWAALRAGCC